MNTARAANADPDLKFMSATEAARYLGVHRDTLKKMTAAGLPTAMPTDSGRPRYTLEALREWQRERGRQAAHQQGRAS